MHIVGSRQRIANEITEQTPELTHTVTFDLNGGELIAGEIVQTVEDGGAAAAPEVTNGRLELSWDWVLY